MHPPIRCLVPGPAIPQVQITPIGSKADLVEISTVRMRDEGELMAHANTRTRGRIEHVVNPPRGGMWQRSRK
jgi:hypothetical protein